MLKRLLLIDDDSEARDLLRYCVRRTWPDAEVDRFDPATDGVSGPAFDWSRYDVLFLHDKQGSDAKDNLSWMRGLRRGVSFPPVVVLSEEVSKETSERARRLGARYYIDKHDLSPRVVANAVTTALRDRDAASQSGADSEDGAIAEDTEWVMVNEISSLFDLTKAPSPKSPPAASKASRPKRGEQLPPGLPGTITIPGYRLVDVIANGTSASVFLAVRERDRRQMVLKIISTDVEDDKEVIKRFMREHRLLAQLHHPNVVKIYGGGVTQEAAYLAMEHFPGGDLRKRIEGGIDRDKALEYFRGIAKGLGAAHELGIIHRDIKPGNILLRKDDSVAIADFGISKSLGASTAITIVGCVMGTPSYISPEQINGEAADCRSDLYSLGVILFELLTGERPYAETRLPALLRAHTERPVPKLPEALDDMQFVVEGLMAKKPRDRFQTVHELLVALGPE